MPRFVFLDESHTDAKWHRILSVGGVIVEAASVAEVESAWRDAKRDAGLAERDLKFSMTWPEGSGQRLRMIETIPTLPLEHAVVALLEDFRPTRMKLFDKEKRGDLYVHRGCFEYVLQRLCAPQYAPGPSGVHLVAFDNGDHFPKLDQQYRGVHGHRWPLPWGGHWPSLREVGYAESLASTREGALNEIADLVVGTVTRWAACRCGIARGKQIPERAELDRACRAVLHLFPHRHGTTPKQWTGWSFAVHTRELTGKEQLKGGLDEWLRDIELPF